ncbi:MAG: recombinase family protein [Gemmatales bacterium]
MAGVSCIIHPYSTQPKDYLQLSSQELSRSKLRAFWLVVVLSGCLDPLRLSLSTLSAHIPTTPVKDKIEHEEPGDREVAASYARYSSDNQDPTSLPQQHDKNRQAGANNGHHIPKTLEFNDEAVSGTKLRRTGLDALVAGAKEGKYRVIYFWNISRLAREVAISIPLLKELVKVYGIRIICVSEAIDSQQPSWELNAIFNSYMAQEYLNRLREDVKRGTRYALEKGYSVGDLCFGYVSEPIPDTHGAGKNRKQKPRKRRMVDPSTAEWVVKIFHWYTVELRSINWIRNELNRKGAPKDSRSSSRKGWLNTCVRNLLANLKYVGVWRYGLTKVIINPLNGVKTQVQRKESDPEVVTLHFPELRIIDDETFGKAQARLRENEEKVKNYRYKNGRFKGSSHDLQAPRHLLQGLMRCKNCGCTLQMNGLRGKYLQCSGYPRNECPIKTSLFRSYAEKALLELISRRILEDVPLRKMLLEAVRAAWLQSKASNPMERESLEKQKRDIQRKINHLVDQVESGGSHEEIVSRLNSRRRELMDLDRKLEGLDQTPEGLQNEPSEDWVIQKLRKLHLLLQAEPALAGVALRKLIGTIEVHEEDFPGLKRKRLVGTFSLSPAQIASSVLGMQLPMDQPVERVVLSFAPMPEWAERANEVKKLYDENHSAVTIAAQLGLKFGAIAKALRWWFTQRDMPVPSGSEKRDRIMRPTPIQDAVMEKVIRLWKEHWPIHLIAKEVGCSRNSVTVMIKKWHHDNGLPWLNGQARRKQIREERDRKKDQDAA